MKWEGTPTPAAPHPIRRQKRQLPLQVPPRTHLPVNLVQSLLVQSPQGKGGDPVRPPPRLRTSPSCPSRPFPTWWRAAPPENKPRRSFCSKLPWLRGALETKHETCWLPPPPASPLTAAGQILTITPAPTPRGQAQRPASVALARSLPAGAAGSRRPASARPPGCSPDASSSRRPPGPRPPFAR